MGRNARMLCLLITVVLGVSALLLLLTGVRVLVIGVHPPEGTGSLGHVGIAVAGGGMIFLSIVAALFSFYTATKVWPRTKNTGRVDR